ncbi:MAG: RIP metalloprotease RseP [Lactobacillus sp.]|nr:RIP metalloprotease RseP [Lactobacillus sp.]
MKGIIVFIIVFGIIVLVHEFGHFALAKLCGVRVREFSIGMGPKLFQVRKAETLYTIRWLPIGGYVRLASSMEEDEIKPGTPVILQIEDGLVTRIDTSNSDNPIEGIPVRVTNADLTNALEIKGYENGDEEVEKTYQVSPDCTVIDAKFNEVIIAPANMQVEHLKTWQKFSVNIAGPIMNILLGVFMLFVFSFASEGPSVNIVKSTTSDSPAHQVLKANDRIIKINNQKLALSEVDKLVNTVSNSKGKTLTITFKRNSQVITKKITPKKENKRYIIGVLFQADNSLGAKIKRGYKLSVNMSTLIFSALKRLFTHFNLNRLSGPVGIYSQTKNASSMGITYICFFLGMLSMNIGMVNLIPIPGLDGGKVLLNIVEMIIRRPIPEKYETAILIAGVVILVGLMIATTINDIYRYFIK